MCVSDWMKVEQRVEPAKRAAQVLHKKLQGCMQSQSGLEAEKRMVLELLRPRGRVWKHLIGPWKVLHLLLSPQKKLPLMLLSISMAESLKDFDAESSIRWQVWYNPSIPPWPEPFTNDCCHVMNLMTSVWRFSVLDEKERGSHTLSTACDYNSIHVFYL